jgi:hypothetical protein
MWKQDVKGGNPVHSFDAKNIGMSVVAYRGANYSKIN